jgi:integrase
VFPTTLGTADNWSNVRNRAWAPTLKALGLNGRGYRPHDLRHRETTKAIEEMARELARERARHATSEMTEHYNHSQRMAEILDEMLLAPVVAGARSEEPEPAEHNLSTIAVPRDPVEAANP